MELVKVSKRKGRDNYEAEWADPKTGKRKRRSLKTNIKRTAERAAGKLEKEILEGTFVATRKDKWLDVKERYLADLKTQKKSAEYIGDINSTLRSIENHIKPGTLQAIDEEAIEQLTKKLTLEVGKAKQADGERASQSPQTTAKHLRNVKRLLNWAKRKKLLTEVPAIDMPEGSSRGVAKGRRLTTEEFERMLSAVDQVCKEPLRKPMKRLLKGLWLSGLRLGEALALSWGPTPDAISLELFGKRPMFKIPRGVDKSKKERRLPMPPDFAAWIDETPDDNQTGQVFPIPHTTDWASKTICKIGRKANVKVSESKSASAHDLRRSFGFRWADMVKPNVLQQLMRHAEIQTTFENYLVSDEDDIAETVWSAFEVKNCTVSVPRSSGHAEKEPQTLV